MNLTELFKKQEEQIISDFSCIAIPAQTFSGFKTIPAKDFLRTCQSEIIEQVRGMISAREKEVLEYPETNMGDNQIYYNEALTDILSTLPPAMKEVMEKVDQQIGGAVRALGNEPPNPPQNHEI